MDEELAGSMVRVYQVHQVREGMCWLCAYVAATWVKCADLATTWL